MSHSETIPSLYEIFDASLPRLAPGDPLVTRQAIHLLLSEQAKPGSAIPEPQIKILDLGCGNGAQTMELAKQTDCTILAVDNHQPFLDELRQRAVLDKVDEKIEPRLSDMHNLHLEEGSFDLIWSEGALYVMGVTDGLNMCHRLLVPDGLLGMTELVWLKPDPPKPCQQFFADEYPAMEDIATNLNMMEACGYEIVHHFTLPESAWWNYYRPLETRLRSLREKYAADPERLAVIEAVQTEVDIYRTYSDCYGYEFFLLKQK